MEYSSPNKEQPQLPPVSYMRLKGEDAQEHARKCRDYLDSLGMYEHPYHVRRHSRWRRGDLFKQAIQWLRKSYNTDPVVSMHFAPLEFRSENDPDYIPTPVFDEFSAPINNEAARLGRPEYKPYIRPRGERPDVETRTGARLGEQVLQSMLQDMRWPEQEELGYTHMPLYGGWWLESYWDASWEKTTKIPVQGAVRCPSCEFKMASPEISEEQAVPYLQKDSVKPKVGGTLEEPTFSYEATECLTCEPRTESRVSVVEGLEGPEPITEETEIPVPALEPFTPVDEELSQADHFGRPLGEDVPLGEWKCRTRSPYDVFLSNLGIDQSPSELTEWYQCRVESLDYFRNRWDNAHLIKPEKAEALMKYHPIAGERAMFFGAGLYGTKLFQSHARLKQFHKKPWREPQYDKQGNCTGLKMNRGRSIIMGADVLLFDGDYLIESKNNPGTFIPRVHMDYAAFEARSGGREFDGMSMSERLFDACENNNEILSQVQDARIQEGSPKWLETRMMNTDYESGGGAGSRWLYDPDPTAPGLKPERIGNELISPQIYEELQYGTAYVSRASSMTETERGVPPTGITAALALQFLQEQSGELRRPRIRAIREMLMRVFSHGLSLCSELVREPRPYWIEEDRGNWSEKAWKGTDLSGQTDVRIDAEPDHDTDLQRQQRIMDFVKDIMRNIPDAKLARKVARKMHVDESLFEEDNLQEETAQREFCDWIRYDEEPVLDDDLDAHETHYDVHGVDVMKEEFRDLEDESGWDSVVPLLSGWRDMFFSQTLPATVPGMPPQQIPGLDERLKAQGLPPTPEDPQGSPPIKSLELRILKMWELLLKQGGYRPEPGTEEALAKVMRFRAHMAAHKATAEKQKQAAAMGQQVLAAPEAPEQTMAGTVPTSQGQNANLAA